MNIYVHELRALYKNTFIWSAAMCATAAVFMFFYPVINADLDNLLSLLDNFPPLMKTAFGIISENFTSALGFYTFGFMYILLFASIQAMNIGVSIVSKEVREKTADFLMTKPVSRAGILTAKILSALTVFVFTSAVYFGVSTWLVSAFAGNGFDFSKLALINLSVFFLQLIFFFLGLAVSVPAKKIKAVLPISLGIVFFFYAVSVFAVTSESDKLRYITPFQFFKADSILQGGAYEPVFLFISAAFIATCAALSYIVYNRKSIHSV